MDGSSRGGPSRPKSLSLSLEALEDRLLLSVLSPLPGIPGPSPSPEATSAAAPIDIRGDGLGQGDFAGHSLVAASSWTAGQGREHGAEGTFETQQPPDARGPSEVSPVRDRSTQVLSPDGKEPNLPGPNPSAQEGLVHHRDLFERLLPLPVVPSAAAEAPAGIPPRLTARENLPGQDVLTVVSGGPGPKADAAAQAEMPPEPFEESEAPPAAPWAGTPLAGILPFDLRALERGVDTFFMRLGQLQEDWRDPRSVVEVASLVAVMTAVGFEFARLRREARDQPGTEEAAEPDPAARFPGDDA